MSWWFLGLSEPEMSISEVDIRGDKRFFDIFVLLDSVPGGVRFLRRVVQSKVEFNGLLLSYSEHATDADNYPNEYIVRLSGKNFKKAWFEFKKYRFFPKNSKFSRFRNLFGFFLKFLKFSEHLRIGS